MSNFDKTGPDRGDMTRFAMTEDRVPVNHSECTTFGEAIGAEGMDWGAATISGLWQLRYGTPEMEMVQHEKGWTIMVVEALETWGGSIESYCKCVYSTCEVSSFYVPQTRATSI